MMELLGSKKTTGFDIELHQKHKHGKQWNKKDATKDNADHLEE